MVIHDESGTVDCNMVEEAVMEDGGIKLLLNLTKYCSEELQCAVAKAIANFSVNAKAVAEESGISILVDLAGSKNRLVAEEAYRGLWNLSVGKEHKGAIAEADGVHAFVDLIFQWHSGGDGLHVELKLWSCLLDPASLWEYRSRLLVLYQT